MMTSEMMTSERPNSDGGGVTASEVTRIPIKSYCTDGQQNTLLLRLLRALTFSYI